jgi:uncharacterized protein (DUF1697 family)
VTRYIALLRAVNVGGVTVRMEALRRLIEGLGGTNVRSLLQSGNLVFDVSEGTPSALERRLEERTEATLGVRTRYFLRTPVEWRAILDRNPFPDRADRDPGHLVVCVLAGAPTAAQWKALADAIPGREQVRAGGRHAYLVYPDGIGTSRLTPATLERALGTAGTSRNWNTVRKLDALASEPGSPPR